MSSGAERRLDARQRLKFFVLQRLLDRAQAVRPLRMAGRRQVVEAGGMAEEEGGHSARLRRSQALVEVLYRDFASRLTPAGGGLLSGTKKSTCSGWLGIDAVLIEIGDALAGQKCVVDQEVPGESSSASGKCGRRPRP